MFAGVNVNFHLYILHFYVRTAVQVRNRSEHSNNQLVKASGGAAGAQIGKNSTGHCSGSKPGKMLQVMLLLWRKLKVLLLQTGENLAVHAVFDTLEKANVTLIYQTTLTDQHQSSMQSLFLDDIGPRFGIGDFTANSSLPLKEQSYVQRSVTTEKDQMYQTSNKRSHSIWHAKQPGQSETISGIDYESGLPYTGALHKATLCTVVL